MARTLRQIVVVVGTGALALALLQAPSIGAERAERGAYPQPKAGPWKLKDAFKESAATLNLKAGARGKSPVVKKIKITVLEEDNGADCPAAGAVLKVKGSFALRKGPKWADDFFNNEFAWISAKQDKPYDDDPPNERGMKMVPATVKIGTEVRNADLAIGFVKPDYNKPHLLVFTMRLYPAGAVYESQQGWCRFDLDGKHG